MNRQSSSTSASGFEFVSENVDNEDGTSVDIQEFIPLTIDALQDFYDDDGRIANSDKLREAVFNGGCSSDIRIKVWPFLFEVYPFSSTKRERDAISMTNFFNYQALKHKCKAEINGVLIVDDVKESPYANLDMCTLDGLQKAAELFAEKKQYDFKFQDWYRVVDKDIPRTDIEHSYFDENHDYEVKMRNILTTFGVIHPQIGYVQVSVNRLYCA